MAVGVYAMSLAKDTCSGVVKKMYFPLISLGMYLLSDR